MTQIHPTAIVHPEAILKEGVVIGPYAIVGQHVEIGENTEVMAHAFIDGRSKIGKNNVIYPSASIGLPPQDIKFKNDPTRLIIGDNNHIREFSTIHLSSTLEMDTVVGDNNLIMAYAHVAHNCQIGSYVILANAVNLAGYVQVHDHATVGGVTAVLQFVKIGTHAFVGGASALKKDVPPYTRGQGMYRYNIAGINTVGLSRKGFTQEQIDAIKAMYKIFYRSNLNVSQAIDYAETLPTLTIEQQEFLNFCKNSLKGISKY